MNKKILLAPCEDYQDYQDRLMVAHFALKDLMFGEEVIDSESLKKLAAEEIQRRKEEFEKNRKRGRELLVQFASHYKK